jgi:hypothetical protein
MAFHCSTRRGYATCVPSRGSDPGLPCEVHQGGFAGGRFGPTRLDMEMMGAGGHGSSVPAGERAVTGESWSWCWCWC